MKKTIQILIGILLFTGIVTISATAQFAGGAGTEEDPYQIATVEQLQEISNNLSRHFILIQDIDARSTKEWNTQSGFKPLGSSLIKFTGSLNGNNYSIDSLFISNDDDYVGLFGYIENALLSNITLSNINITGNQFVGGLVGRMQQSSVHNITLNGKVNGLDDTGGVIGRSGSQGSIGGVISDISVSIEVFGGSYTGGIVGTSYSEIRNSESYGTVQGLTRVGGVVGWGRSNISECISFVNVTGYTQSSGWGAGSIGGLAGDITANLSNSSAHGEVNGVYDVGGLVGGLSGSGLISNCFSTGDITGQEMTSEFGGIGGLVGRVYEASVFGSYSVSNVTGVNRVGGLVGQNRNDSNISNCYSTGTINGVSEIGGIVGQNINNSVVVKTFFTGRLVGSQSLGGIVGLNGATVDSSYWDTATSKISTPVGIGESSNSYGYKTAQMTTDSAYYYLDGFDFDRIWHLTEGYPAFQWEDVAAIPHPNMEPPTLVELTSPSDGSINVQIPATLTWNIVEADGYQLHLSPSLNFDTPFIDVKEIESSSFTIDTPLLFGTEYYWRVRAKNLAGYGPWSDTLIFTTEFALPTAVLDSPMNQAESVSISPTLFWKPVTDANDYELLVATDSLFQETITISQPKSKANNDQKTQNWLIAKQLNGLLYETRYYWKVRALGDNGFSDWSETRSFVTKPESPTGIALVSPASDAVDQVFTPEFVWTENTLSSLYQLQISDEPNFDAPLLDKADLDTTSYTYSTGLSPYMDYYWRVRGINAGENGQWSAIYKFTTKEETLGASPQTLFPVSGEQNVAVPSEFTWSSIEGATSYDLKISLSTTADTSLVISNYPDTVALVSEILMDTTTYYWSVRAKVDDTYTNWSPYVRFTTELRTPERPSWTPTNEQKDVTLPVLLSWSKSARSSNYDIVVSSSEDFSDLVFEASIDSVSITLDESVLSGGTNYFWRVRGINSSGSSDWSEVLSFTTITQTSTESEVVLEFALSQNYPNPFNPSTNIEFSLPESQKVELSVFDIQGKRIATLLNESKSAGKHSVTFDAHNLASGIYIYRLTTGMGILTRKMILMK